MGFSKDLVVSAGSGNFLKTPPGATKIRVVSDAVRFWKDFDNKKQYVTEEAAKLNPDAKIRYALWVIDRADGVIKMWECSGGIVKDMQALAESTEYAFDGQFPYDIIVNRVGSTLQDTRYTITPARQNTALTPEEIECVKVLEPMALYLRGESEDKSQVAPF